MSAAIVKGRWLKNERRNRSFAATWGVMAGCSLIAGVVVLTVSAGNGKLGGGLAAFAVFGMMGLATGWYAVGCARAGLLVADDKIVIKNPTAKREVSTSDVRRFTAGEQPGQIANPTPGVMVELDDGRRYRVWTFAREGFVWNTARNVGRWNATADALNDLILRNH